MKSAAKSGETGMKNLVLDAAPLFERWWTQIVGEALASSLEVRRGCADLELDGKARLSWQNM